MNRPKVETLHPAVLGKSGKKEENTLFKLDITTYVPKCEWSAACPLTRICDYAFWQVKLSDTCLLDKLSQQNMWIVDMQTVNEHTNKQIL